MPRFPRAALLGVSVCGVAASPAFARLESEIEFPAMPELRVSLNETTGAVSNRACTQGQSEPLLVYDTAGNVVALVYVPDEADDC